MKTTHRILLIAISALSFGAIAGPMEECNTLPTPGSRAECKYTEQRKVAMQINARLERIALNPNIYGEANSKTARGQAREFDRIKAMCQGANECLFKEYSVWNNELIALQKKVEGGWPKVTQVSNDRSGRQFSTAPSNKRSANDALSRIPEYNPNNESGE